MAFVAYNNNGGTGLTTFYARGPAMPCRGRQRIDVIIAAAAGALSTVTSFEVTVSVRNVAANVWQPIVTNQLSIGAVPAGLTELSLAAVVGGTVNERLVVQDAINADEISVEAKTTGAAAAGDSVTVWFDVGVP